LVRTNNSAIDNRASLIDFELKFLEYGRPMPFAGPVRETVVDSLPRPETLWQVSPWKTCLGTEEDGFDEQAIA
jgi:hypothetical protein